MGGAIPLTFDRDNPPYDIQVYERFRKEVVRPVVEKLNSTTPRDDDQVGDVLRSFWQRAVALSDAIFLLRCTKPDGCGYECGVLLRVMYDMCLQALWMMHDKASRDERAKLYVEYSHIERWKRWQDLDNVKSPALDSIKKHDARRDELGANYKRVVAQYEDRKGNPRPNWYPGTLRDLAKQVGLLDEYLFLLKDLHDITHVSTIRYAGQGGMPDESVLSCAWTVLARVLDLATEHMRLKLSDEVSKALKQGGRSLMLVAERAQKAAETAAATEERD